jgi:hypothetical protein
VRDIVGKMDSTIKSIREDFHHYDRSCEHDETGKWKRAHVSSEVYRPRTETSTAKVNGGGLAKNIRANIYLLIFSTKMLPTFLILHVQDMLNAMLITN